ncbi:MAG: cytochrome c oxidase subunit 3 family protein [Spartobacteria bacterium]
MSEIAAAPLLAEQFDDLDQQRAAAKLGMWIFLATEVMFFGGLFLAYTVYRYLHPDVFAEASRHTAVILGGANTGVLLFSSTLMALAVRAAQLDRRKHLVWLLLATALLGIGFMVIKGFEYHHDFIEHLVPGASFVWTGTNRPAAEMFFWLYFAMTGLHAIHVTIGIVLLLILAVRAQRRNFAKGNFMPVEIVGLYWHFVDIVWVFLFPLLYLAGHR